MHWDLSKIYEGYNAPSMSKDIAAFDAIVEEINRQLASLSDLPSTCVLETLLRQIDDAMSLVTRLNSFTMLTLAVNTSDEAALADYNRVLNADNALTKILSGLCRCLKNVADMDALIGDSPFLEAHRFYLENCKNQAAHVMDAATEPLVLDLQTTGGKAWEQLYTQLCSHLMVPLNVNGETHQLPLSTIRGYYYSADAELRRKAYEAELATYPSVEIPVAACLNAIKGESLTVSRLRHYPSLLDASLELYRMDRQTLDALLNAVRSHFSLFRRYHKLKARLLGYTGGLKYYDLFAPVGNNKQSYTIDQARTLLREVMGKFSPKMSDFIDRCFEENLIDPLPAKGKQGGAFCAPIHPLGVSYVLSNFDGSFGAVTILAHELGHAYHGDCMKHCPILMASAPLPLCETASIFNEILLTEKALETSDPMTAITIIDQQLSNASQTVLDIFSRFLFESRVMEQRQNRYLSPSELCEFMRSAQLEAYGDGLNPEYLHPYMWICKPHYYSPDVHFYNFPYAFGQLFALGVYDLYLKKGNAFLPEYDRLLAATGTGKIRDVAKIAGINVASEDFWFASLDILSNKVDRLEALANTVGL